MLESAVYSQALPRSRYQFESGGDGGRRRIEVWEEGEERDDGRRGEYWTEIGG